MSKKTNWLMADMVNKAFLDNTVEKLEAIDDRWADFGYTIWAERPVENEIEDQGAFLIDPHTMQPIFRQNMGSFRGSESLGDAIHEAQELARKPRYTCVRVSVRVAKGYFSIGDVAVFKNGTVSYSNPERLDRHEVRIAP